MKSTDQESTDTRLIFFEIRPMIFRIIHGHHLTAIEASGITGNTHA